MEKVTLTIFNNGPINVKGDFEILDQNGNPYDLGGRNVVSLCRCGHSANKPFCDGSHKKVGFTHEATAFALPPKKA
ncbi:MAG: hypothetical protein KatS3mg029_0877 [Saprospiraceae bacterium]|nr:MAG: hypothetical protein KatS3mg029_0877 [Saprospiraceae bacterium]